MEEFYFDMQATKEYAGIVLRRIFFGVFSWIVYVALLVPPFLEYRSTGDPLPLIVAAALLLSILFILRTFLRQKLESDEESPLLELNEACLLSYEMLRRLRKKRQVTAEDLWKAALSTKRGQFVLKEMALERKDIEDECSEYLREHPFELQAFLHEGVELLQELGEKQIDANIVLYLFFKQGGVFEEVRQGADLSVEDVKRIVQWEGFHERTRKRAPFLSPQGLVREFGGAGRSWVMGYTEELDRLTDDISSTILWTGKRHEIIHRQAIESTLHILSRSTQHNVLILGGKGSGRRTLVRNVAYALRTNELKRGRAYTRILVLKTQQLLSGTASPDAFFLQALRSAEEGGHFILVIEDLALLMKGSGANLKGVLSKFLGSKNISVIGLSFPEEYHTLIKTEPGLDTQFEKVFLEDASEEETMGVLMEHYFGIEERENVQVTYKALKSIVELSQRYVGVGSFPGKAVDVLNDAVLMAKKSKQPLVTEEHIRHVVSLKAHMDVGEVTESEKENLLKLEEIMQQRIVGQDYAIRALVNTLKRARLDIGAQKRPRGTFLFLGPTGVGKTLTAKVLSEVYFGSPENLIRLDMNEYSTETSIADVIGSSEKEGFLTKRVQDRPSSLILLDEIEKAHPKVLNIFLQILDEGMLTDGRGVKTDFRNTIIIATSNAGALFIRDFIKEHRDLKKDDFKKSLVDTILEQKIFSPEFLNRFDEVILYFPLSEEDAQKVAILLMNGVISELQEKKGIRITVEPEVVNAIVQKGYSIEFGARAMRRAVMEIVENYIADYMLTHEVKRGDEIVIRREDIVLE